MEALGWGGGQGKRVTFPKPNGLQSSLPHLRVGVSISPKSSCGFFCDPAEVGRRGVPARGLPQASPGGWEGSRACFTLHLALRCRRPLCLLSVMVFSLATCCEVFSQSGTQSWSSWCWGLLEAPCSPCPAVMIVFLFTFHIALWGQAGMLHAE